MYSSQHQRYVMMSSESIKKATDLSLDLVEMPFMFLMNFSES